LKLFLNCSPNIPKFYVYFDQERIKDLNKRRLVEYVGMLPSTAFLRYAKLLRKHAAQGAALRMGIRYNEINTMVSSKPEQRSMSKAVP
jgi:hypothetical protein